MFKIIHSAKPKKRNTHTYTRAHERFDQIESYKNGMETAWHRPIKIIELKKKKWENWWKKNKQNRIKLSYASIKCNTFHVCQPIQVSWVEKKKLVFRSSNEFFEGKWIETNKSKMDLLKRNQRITFMHLQCLTVHFDS